VKAREQGICVGNVEAINKNRARALSPAIPIEPERRVVTVLYADIVGSTKIISELDPDDAADFLDPAINKIIRSVHNFGGTVARVQGDGVKAVFGATQTQEDHALRAVMAGLEMVKVLQEAPLMPGIPRADLRVGMHSGFVIVRWQKNDMGGGLDTVGSTAHVAAKIEQSVRPNHVALSETTAGLILGDAIFTPLDDTDISQDGVALNIYEVKSIHSPYENIKTGPDDLHPLIGRKDELQRLKALFDTDLRNLKSSISVIGEAGIGKSKLVREASLYAIKKNIRVELIGGISIYKDTPFFVLKSLANKLLRVVHKNGEVSVSPLLTDLELNQREQTGLEKLISPDQSSVAKWDLPVDDKRSAIQSAIVKAVSKAASNSPMVLLIEDLHDVDLESAQCLKYIVSQCSSLPFSILLTTRPQAAELASTILDSKMSLTALPLSDSRLLVERELHSRFENEIEIEEAISDILHRAEGLPLALHEFSKLLIAQRIEGAKLNQMPLALEPLLHQKFDNLSAPADEFVQFASALGNTFNIGQLRETLDLPNDVFQAALAETVDKAVLTRLGNGVFVFAHHLYQEICYDSMVRSRKREIHGKIYSILSQSNFPDDSLTDSYGPQILAYHAQEAGELERALDHLWQACTQAIATAAIRTAQSLYRRAAFICDQIGSKADPRKVKFASLVFDALHQLAAHEETLEVFQSARAQNFRGLSVNEEILIRSNIATIQWILGAPEEAFEQAQKAIEMAERLNFLPLTTYAGFTMANVDHSRGNIRKCVDRLTNLASGFTGKNAAIRFGQTITLPGVMTRTFASWYAVDLGNILLAEKLEAEARQIAEQENHGYSKTLCDLALGYRLYRTDMCGPAASVLVRTYKACIEESFFGIAPMAAAWAGAALIGNNQDKLAGNILDQELKLDHISSVRNSGRYYLYSSQAKLLARSSKLDSAFKSHQKALNSAVETKDPVSEAYAHIEKADLLQQMKRPNREIQAEVEASLKLAKQCEMGLLIGKCDSRLDKDGS
jgi:class 3 adenylate cyclase/tetratricopeptide (TPR) repeat protein